MLNHEINRSFKNRLTEGGALLMPGLLMLWLPE